MEKIKQYEIRKEIIEREKKMAENDMFGKTDSQLYRARLKQKYKKPGGTFPG